MLLPSHSPNLDRLPLFLVRLATEVSDPPSPRTHILNSINGHCQLLYCRWNGIQKKSASRHLLESVQTSTVSNMILSYWTVLRKKTHRHREQLPQLTPPSTRENHGDGWPSMSSFQLWRVTLFHQGTWPRMAVSYKLLTSMTCTRSLRGAKLKLINNHSIHNSMITNHQSSILVPWNFMKINQEKTWYSQKQQWSVCV